MVNKKKVLVLLDNSYFPDSRVENEIDALLSHDYRIDLFCVQHKDLPNTEVHGNLRIYREISSSIHRPFSKEYKDSVSNLVEKILLNEYLIIHCHDFRMFFIGCKVKKLNKNVTLIYDSHEYLAGYPYYRRSKRFSAIIKGFFIWNHYRHEEQKNLKKADYIITVSNKLKDLLEAKSGKPGMLIRNLPPYIKKCKSDCNYWHRHFNIPAEKKIVIHTGNAHFSRKRLMFLLDFFNNDERLAMVFLGTNKSVSEIEKIVKKQRFKNTYFHENVNRSEISYYCSQADIGLIYTWNKKWKSYWFALPNKMMDVSLSGLPVLSTEQPELKSFVEEHEHGICFNGDSSLSLELAINKVLENYVDLKHRADKISSVLNWPEESKKLVELYNKIEGV